jgi:hypothetical protein
MRMTIVPAAGDDLADILNHLGVIVAWCQTMTPLAYWIPAHRLMVLNATADRDELADEARALVQLRPCE